MHQDGSSPVSVVLSAESCQALIAAASAAASSGRSCHPHDRHDQGAAHGTAAKPKGGNGRLPKVQQKGKLSAGKGSGPDSDPDSLAKRRKGRCPRSCCCQKQQSDPAGLQRSVPRSQGVPAVLSQERQEGEASSTAPKRGESQLASETQLEDGVSPLPCSRDDSGVENKPVRRTNRQRKAAATADRWERLHSQFAELTREFGCFRQIFEQQSQVQRELSTDILSEIRVRSRLLAEDSGHDSVDGEDWYDSAKSKNWASASSNLDLMDLGPVDPGEPASDRVSPALATTV